MCARVLIRPIICSIAALLITTAAASLSYADAPDNGLVDSVSPYDLVNTPACDKGEIYEEWPHCHLQAGHRRRSHP
jgi:hypothetical protein